MGFSIGNKIIHTDEELKGFHIGNLKVDDRAVVKFSGSIVGNVLAVNGARVEVTGHMVGNVVANGSDVKVGGKHIGNRISLPGL